MWRSAGKAWPFLMHRLWFWASDWWNSPYINHFISADTIVASYANAQGLNRYSYVTNNPLRYTDPTGHMRVEETGGSHGSFNCSKYPQYCNNGKKKSDHELNAMNPIRQYIQKKTVDRILAQNPSFNPFTTGFQNPNDYRGSEAEIIDAKFLNLYKSLGIDIDSYANQGLPNPLSYDQVPKDLQIRLPLPANDPQTQFFLSQLQDVTGNTLIKNNMLNYEPNYVYSLMKSHPDVLAQSVATFNTENDWLNELMDKVVSPE